MDYIITFLEGVISFISPCMLPMLPVYVSYFTGSSGGKRHTVSRSAAFVAGFTLVFCALGVFAGTLGAFVTRNRTILNIVCGVIVIVFGLSYLDIVPLPFFHGMASGRKVDGLLSAFLFGMIYSVSLTPCVGAFLGSAIMLAATSGSVIKGLFLLLLYSLGLGLPFMLAALLLERLETVFSLIKRHYGVINRVCGIFLIVIGVLMALGLLNRLLLRL